jgi:hypothetical protein
MFFFLIADGAQHERTDTMNARRQYQIQNFMGMFLKYDKKRV